MPRRRSNAEIREVEAIHDRTRDIARDIDSRVNTEPEDHPDFGNVSITARPHWGVRADYQRMVADDIVVSFTTKDPETAERVARAMKEALRIR